MPPRIHGYAVAPCPACGGRQRAEAAAASVQLPALPLLAYGAYSDIRDANLDHLRAKAADKGCGHLGVMHSERYLGSVPVPDQAKQRPERGEQGDLRVWISSSTVYETRREETPGQREEA